ncbi:hypothetical protein BDV12DRAFT_131490 [Aspergillus spectabilis]
MCTFWLEVILSVVLPRPEPYFGFITMAQSAHIAISFTILGFVVKPSVGTPRVEVQLATLYQRRYSFPAHQAEKAGARPDLIVAALSHDIGQIIPLNETFETRMTLKAGSTENVG